MKASSSSEMTPSESATLTIAAKWSLFRCLNPEEYKFEKDIFLKFSQR
jgi:hypothetical protein